MSAPIVLTINQINKEPYEKNSRLCIICCSIGYGNTRCGAVSKPEDAVKYRQSAFTIMGNHMGRVGAMVMGRVPFDAKAAQDSTRVLALVSTLPGQTFTANTESVQGSKALPAIWKEQDKFKAGSRQVMTRWWLRWPN